MKTERKREYILFIMIFLAMIVLWVTHVKADPIISITYPDTHPTIGRTFTVHYEVIPNDIEVDHLEIRWPYSEGNTTWFPEDGETTELSGDISTIPKEGETIYCEIRVKSKDGILYYDQGDPLSLSPNPDFNIEILFDREIATPEDVVTANYRISGGTGTYTNISAKWGLVTEGEEGESLRFGSEQQLTGNTGSINYTVSSGKGLVLAILVTDEEGYPAFVESEMLPIEGGTSLIPEISITYESDQAIIGKPFKAHYNINTHGVEMREIEIRWPYTHGWTTYFPGSETELFSGDVETIPTEGEQIACEVHLVDHDGVIYYHNGGFVPLIPNPDVNIAVTFESSSVLRGETVTAHYTITGGSGEYSYIGVQWGLEDGEFIRYADSYEELQSSEGTVSRTAESGVAMYLAVKVTDTEGIPGYVVSAPVRILNVGEPEQPDHPKIELSCDSKYAVIGEPLTVHYKLTGYASGYGKIDLSWDCWSDVWLMPHQSSSRITVPATGEKEGDFQIVPECGTRLTFSANAQADKEMWVSSDYFELPLMDNPAFDIRIELSQESRELGVPIIASYSIAAKSTDCRQIETWWDVSTQYEDLSKTNIAYTSTEETSGESIYTPERLSYEQITMKIRFNVRVFGEDGTIGYAISDQITLNVEALQRPQLVLTVPEGPAILGQSLTVAYQVTNYNGPLKNLIISFRERFYVHDYMITKMDEIMLGDTDVLSGFVQYTPRSGDVLELFASASNEDGWGFSSDWINVEVQSDPAIDIRLVSERNTVGGGGTAEIAYSIASESGIERIQGGWKILTQYEDVSRQEDLILTDVSGTASVKAARLYEDIETEQIFFWLHVTDSEGRIATACTAPIQVLLNQPPYYGLDIFTLPTNIERIEQEAFADTNPEVIIVPRKCQYIAEDAFARCMRLKYIVNRSTAAINADENVTVIQEE